MEVVDKSTIEFIRKIIHELEIRGVWDRRFHWFFSREAPDEKNMESYLEIIFELESMIEFNLETLLQPQEKKTSINVNYTKIKFKTSLPFIMMLLTSFLFIKMLSYLKTINFLCLKKQYPIYVISLKSQVQKKELRLKTIILDITSTIAR
ncbi:hypothetical protein WFK84_12435 [Yersinia enterocolitica]